MIVENYRSDVKYRLKVDYESVKKVNPRIVYGSIAGFGQNGPDAARPGVDQIAQGMGGLMSITGEPGRGPMRVGIPDRRPDRGPAARPGDHARALQSRAHRKGQWVHTSLIEAQIFMLDFQAARWLMKGEVPKQAGNDHPTSIPTGVFPTSDGHINIAASGQHMFKRFAEALGSHGAARPSRARDAAAALAEPQGAERAHQRGHQDQHLGPLDRRAQQGGRAVRADQHDRPDLRRAAGPASRHRARRSSIPSSARSRWSATRSTSRPRRSPRS